MTHKTLPLSVYVFLFHSLSIMIRLAFTTAAVANVASSYHIGHCPLATQRPLGICVASLSAAFIKFISLSLLLLLLLFILYIIFVVIVYPKILAKSADKETACCLPLTLFTHLCFMRLTKISQYFPSFFFPFSGFLMSAQKEI